MNQKSKFNRKDKIVLVGVLKNRRDLKILLTEKWYRMPVAYAPKRLFHYLAFYQPALFGREGKGIQYYARVLNSRTFLRSDLLPAESSHPRAGDYYFKIRVGKIRKLSRPIKNTTPRRVSFGFTTLKRLLKSKNILELYGVAPTEEMVGRALKRAGIKAIPQYYVLGGKKRYCLDFAVFCKKGTIAIECDNKKAHSSPGARKKDKIKNAYLRRHGLRVIRLKEFDIIKRLDYCLNRVEKLVQDLGGQIDEK